MSKSKPVDYTQLEKDCVLETITALSNDIKTHNKFYQDKRVRNYGCWAMGAVVGFIAGKYLTTRDTWPNRTSRILGHLLWGTGLIIPIGGTFYVWNRDYTRQKLEKHPIRERIIQIDRSYAKFDNYIRHIKSKEERKESQQLVKDWKLLIQKTPLYRNNDEFQDLMTKTTGIAHICHEAYKNASDVDVNDFIRSFNRWWVWPSIEKTFKVRIRHEYDAAQFMQWLEQQKSEQKSESKETWTLGMPDNEGEFWKWFYDPRTGKPKRVKKAFRAIEKK